MGGGKNQGEKKGEEGKHIGGKREKEEGEKESSGYTFPSERFRNVFYFSSSNYFIPLKSVN